MARALIVGCGCRGRELGRQLLDGGWAVRGTTRDEGGRAAIEEVGIEPAIADPDRAITIVELIGDVAVVCWLLASADGDAGRLAAIHGPRLERLLEELVDTPVRGFVYEAAGSVAREHLEAGKSAVGAASERWHIPFELIDADPSRHEEWTLAAKAAVERVIA